MMRTIRLRTTGPVAVLAVSRWSEGDVESGDACGSSGGSGSETDKATRP